MKKLPKKSFFQFSKTSASNDSSNVLLRRAGYAWRYPAKNSLLFWFLSGFLPGKTADFSNFRLTFSCQYFHFGLYSELVLFTPTSVAGADKQAGSGIYTPVRPFLLLRRGNLKDEWTGTEYQTPAPKIEVFFPSNKTSDDPSFVFRSEQIAEPMANLTAYQFSESVDDLEGFFSFTAENGEVNGKSIFDYIPVRSVIKIYEGGKQAAFVGIILGRRFSKQMTQKGIKQTITFSGKSIISCVVEYSISLDMRINGVTISEAKNMQMLSAIDNISPLTIKKFMTETWNFFKKIANDVSDKKNGIATIEIEDIIKRHIGESPDDFISVTGSEKDFRYPISGALINARNNTITDIWKDKLPEKVYELYAYCDDGKPKIMARQVPFGDPENNYADWKNLTPYIIRPISLTAYDLNQNAEDVYTAFASSIVGSVRGRNFYMAVNQGQNDEAVAYGKKLGTYGFRLLELTFNGYARENNTISDQHKTLTDTMTTLNKLAAYWYSRNDDMYSGAITLCTNFNNPEKNPRVGCRAEFLGGEFYINKVDHSWAYGGTPTIKLTVSRGFMYDESGKIRDGEGGIIQNVGSKFRELA